MISFRTSNIFMLVIMVTVVIATYKDKYEVQKLYLKMQHIENQIEEKKNTFNLLRTDWALMTQPARLYQLAKKYYNQLHLEETLPEQIVKLKYVPKRKNIIKDIVVKFNLTSDD